MWKTAIFFANASCGSNDNKNVLFCICVCLNVANSWKFGAYVYVNC